MDDYPEGLWHVRFTFTDRANEEFVTLGAVTIGEGEERPVRQAWEALEAAPSGDLLADLWSPEGHIDDRHVTAAAVERATGRTMADMLAKGREDIQALRDEITRRRHAPLSEKV